LNLLEKVEGKGAVDKFQKEVKDVETGQKKKDDKKDMGQRAPHPRPPPPPPWRPGLPGKPRHYDAVLYLDGWEGLRRYQEEERRKSWNPAVHGPRPAAWQLHPKRSKPRTERPDVEVEKPGVLAERARVKE